MMTLLRMPLVTAAALIAFSQQPEKPSEPESQEAPTIKVDVSVVNILCSVRDKNGGLVGNLNRDDFLVTEEGQPQQIKYFERQTDLPLTIGLLVDVSGSQENLIGIERDAAGQFFTQVLGKKDLAFLISFGSEAELLQDLTGSPRLLRKALDDLRVSSSVGGMHPGPVPTMSNPRGTILFDAVYLASTEKLRSQVGRKVIVLITDGVDQGSRVKLREAIRSAHLSDAVIYSIYYFDPSAYAGRGFMLSGDDGDLKRMSEDTGGRVFRVNKKNSLPKIFQQIQEEMRSQYAIGYTPAAESAEGGFRRLEVKTRLKGLKVQARKGYYPSGAEPAE
jgi:VWFA-related protein